MTTEWALVPVEATRKMIEAGARSVRADVSISHNPQSKTARCAARNAYVTMIAESPAAALLTEILAARDEYCLTSNGSHEEDQALYRLIAALAKLGPAAEGAT